MEVVVVCSCDLLVDSSFAPISLPRRDYAFTYVDPQGTAHVLLPRLDIEGVINYAAAHRVTDQYGVKSGYVLVIGEKDGA